MDGLAFLQGQSAFCSVSLAKPWEFQYLLTT